MNRPALPLLARLGSDLPELCAGLQTIVSMASDRDPATGLFRSVDPYALRFLASGLLHTASASRDRVAAAADRLEPHGEELEQLHAALPHADSLGASYLGAVSVHLLLDLLGE